MTGGEPAPAWHTDRVRAAVLALITVGLVSRATPGVAEPWVEPDPAAVVGRWTGPATWRQCAVTGEARPVLVVARDGGGYRVDLAAALDGLGTELLAPVGGRELTATRHDLTVSWVLGSPGHARVRLGFASGCEGTLVLARDTTGAAACDELVALRAIAGGCPAATVPATEPRAPPGRRLRGKPLAALAAGCRRDAAPLRAGLIEAGCVPAPLPAISATTRVPECDALLASVDRLMRCDRVPVATKQRLRIAMGQVDRWATADRDDAEARRTSAATCQETRDELVRTMVVLGCSP